MHAIHTDDAPQAVGPYSQAVVAGNVVYASGQIGLDPKTMEFVGDEVTAQARQALANLQAVLEEAGSGMGHVVKAQVWLLTMDDFAAVNAIYAEAFGDHRPARACVAVSELPKGGRVEIDAIALIPG